ncbi:MAG: 30S ribosomal protein S17 [Candidatus Helarchaeota archaeon]
MSKNIGIEVVPPKKVCEDKNCPFHGKLRVHGKIIEGIVKSTSMDKTIVVRKDYLKFVKKYLRYEKRHSSIHAHCPDCQNPILNKKVKIAECRPLSKTVSFVVIECEEEE